PRQNRLTLLDSGGTPLAGASVQVFQATAGDTTNAVYAKRFDARPDLSLRTDAQGRVDLGHNPFRPTGRVVHTEPYTNATGILPVQQGARVGYGFLEVTDFNLEFWRGHRDLGQLELRVTLF